MKTLSHKFVGTLSLCLLSINAFAIKINRPSYVDDVSVENVEQAGSEIMIWVAAVCAVIIAASAIRPGMLFVQGKGEEALEKSRDLIIGAIIAVIGGGVVFSIMEFFR